MGLDPEGGHCRGFSPCRGAGGECDGSIDFHPSGRNRKRNLPENNNTTELKINQ